MDGGVMEIIPGNVTGSQVILTPGGAAGAQTVNVTTTPGGPFLTPATGVTSKSVRSWHVMTEAEYLALPQPRDPTAFYAIIE
jgi:hypothetical protein